MSKLIYVVFMFVLSLAMDASAVEISPALVGIYSDMARHQESGDVLGTEIIISKTKSGYFAVIQTSEGVPCKPVVVPVVIDGRKIRFSIPSNACYSGTLTGVIKPDGLWVSFGHGALSPHGDKEFLLPKKHSFWERN